MENRKGNGIFLGIVSIATLIVAIIGATFAYFSANTQSNTDAVNLTAYEFKLSLSVSPIYPEGASSLIPMNPNTVIENVQSANKTNLLYALNEAQKKCIDDHGLQVCALYQVTIVNQAVNTITLNGQLKTTANNPGKGDGRTGFKNLTYQALAGNHADNSLSLVGSAVPLAENPEDEPVPIADIVVPGATYNEDNELVPGVGHSYVLVYLNDNGDQSSEMGASFTGQLLYSSGEDAENQLTGTFSVSAPQEPQD